MKSVAGARVLRLGLGAFAIIALQACVSVNKSVLISGLDPIPAADVQVYWADEELPEHSRVAILHASGSDGWTNPTEMIDKLREEAGKLGANAIVIRGINEPSAADRYVNAMVSGVTDGERTGDAIAIRTPPVER